MNSTVCEPKTVQYGGYAVHLFNAGCAPFALRLHEHPGEIYVAMGGSLTEAEALHWAVKAAQRGEFKPLHEWEGDAAR
jgi:hypothetical protein